MAVASSARLALLLRSTPDAVPFCPCTAMVHVKTQGRTLNCPFNFLPPRFVAGWLLSVQTLWDRVSLSLWTGRAVIQAYGCGHPWRWKFAVRGRTFWDGLWRTQSRSDFGGSRVLVPAMERSVKWSCARRSTPQQGDSAGAPKA